jgi:hypothetical protein
MPKAPLSGIRAVMPRMWAVAGTVTLLTILAAASAAMAAVGVAGYVDAVMGKVFAEHPETGKRALDLEAKVHARDVVVTDSGAGVRIVFLDESVLEIKESSRVSISDFAFEEKGGKVLSVKCVTGVFRMVTGKIVVQNPNGLRVETPLALIGVRGTDLAAKAGGKEELHALFSGAPIEIRAGDSVSVIDRPEYGVQVTPGAVGAQRPLTEEEKRLFTRLTFRRQMDMNRLQLLMQGNRPTSRGVQRMMRP